MRGKTRGEARNELMKAGMKAEATQSLLPHKVRVIHFRCTKILWPHFF